MLALFPEELLIGAAWPAATISGRLAELKPGRQARSSRRWPFDDFCERGPEGCDASGRFSSQVQGQNGRFAVYFAPSAVSAGASQWLGEFETSRMRWRQPTVTSLRTSTAGSRHGSPTPIGAESG